MPSYLTTPNPDTFQQQLQQAAGSVQRQSVKHRSPWLGYMPDIDPHRIPPNGTVHSRGLIAKADPAGHGECLMPNDGFQGLDFDNLPLGAGIHRPITMLHMLPRADAEGDQQGRFNFTVMAVTASGSTPGVAGEADLWIIDPVGAAWEIVVFSATASGGQQLLGVRNDLYDVADMASGTSTRTVGGGNIDQPVAVFCNGIDDVMVYPSDDVGGADEHNYDILTDDLGPHFIAKTVEAFNGRLYFGNTVELNSIHHRQRIRRTPVFNCDPDPANIGSGALDIREFSGDLLRLEKLGQVLVAYFTDGVAFIRNTEVATSPDAVQILREKRGLISTHSVVSVEDQKHFGIFDDGWYMLDASGRWQEVGLVDIEGTLTHKWKRTFYENLDIENRERLFVSYDGTLIRIAYPRVGFDDISEVWVYDPKSDRVFVEDFLDGNYITCYGDVNTQIADDLTWDSDDDEYNLFGGNNWSTIFATWASVGSKFGIRALVHGTVNGYVLVHDPDMIARLNTATSDPVTGAVFDLPPYRYHSPMSALGEPRLLKTANKMWLEYIHTGDDSTNMNVNIVGNQMVGSETGVFDLTPVGRANGEVLTAKQFFNFTDTELGFELDGTSPVLIRSMETDFTIKRQEERD